MKIDLFKQKKNDFHRIVFENDSLRKKE